MSEHIEALEIRAWRLEDQLNRLAGTRVNGQPTLGKATAALWWLGHREHRWAHQNLLSENAATGGAALQSTEDFISLDGALLELVEGEGMLGDVAVMASPTTVKGRSVGSGQVKSSIAFADQIPVEPMHIYTASIYTLMLPGAITPSRPNWMKLKWLDELGQPIETHLGDHHASKQEWNLSWVTAPAPEGAAMVQAIIEFQSGPGEQFLMDKAVLYNGSDPQAWAYPDHAAMQLDKGLLAHLNMKAGIFASADFVDLATVCNRLANEQDMDPAMALAMIPTPNPDVVEA